MTQIGEATINVDNYGGYDELKAQLGAFYEYVRTIDQTSTGSAVELEEAGGETITIPAADKTLRVVQKTDQVGTDGGATGVIVTKTSAGVASTSTFTLNAADTTTAVPAVPAVTTHRRLAKFALDDINAADEIILTNVAEDEVYGVIKVGHHQWLGSRYTAHPTKKSYLGKIHAVGDAVAYYVTVVVEYTPKGETLPVSVKRNIDSVNKSFVWEFNRELEPNTDVIITIVDDTSHHYLCHFSVYYLEQR